MTTSTPRATLRGDYHDQMLADPNWAPPGGTSLNRYHEIKNAHWDAFCAAITREAATVPNLTADHQSSRVLVWLSGTATSATATGSAPALPTTPTAQRRTCPVISSSTT